MKSIGENVCVPCEVKKGPFSDERMVKIGEAVAFVNTRFLKSPIETGKTTVIAQIIDVAEVMAAIKKAEGGE
jgi:hypothetical protein